MRKHMFLGVAATIAGAFMALATLGPVGAAPPGAATNLSFGSQVCHADGTVSGTMTWQPSGLGFQYVDLALNANFSNYSTGGPYASSANVVILTQLKPGGTYYARVRTAVAGGTLTSDTLVVTASTCVGDGPITEPTNLSANARPDGTVRFDWRPGDNNRWFCVDTARSLSDLLNLSNTWRNHGCWTTSNTLTVSGLNCGTVYYWLVFSWNTTSNVKSNASVVQTASCAATITPATNLEARRLDGEVLFDWTAGTGNIWYCLDTAKSTGDLLSLTGTWRNHGCWTTETQLVVYDLDCSQTYYWLVYTWNYVANAKSEVSTVQTQACKAQLELAPIVDVDVTKVGNNYRADVIAALQDACHKPDSYRVQRFGNEVEITVWNVVEPGPCAFVYSEYELNINLGSDFVSGQRYRVIVNNDKRDAFVAD